jgi:hypothetical protein
VARRSQLYALSCKLQVSKTESFTAIQVQSAMLSGLTPAADWRGALKVLHSGLFEVSSNLEATTPIIAYAIEIFSFL